jgi:hypothetical protein
MKNILKQTKIAIGLILVLSTFSCSTEEPIGSSVTIYPLISYEGGNTVLLNAGEEFVETATATVDDVEVPVDITYVGRYRGNTYTGSLDTSVPDVYTATYSAQNEDGFYGTSTRQIIVVETGDLVNSIAGLYRSTVFRNGSQPSTNPEDYTDIEYILIWENEDGTYGISDAFGGWYLFGRAIPLSETPGTVIVANNIADNDFSFPGTQTNRYFGGSSEMTEMTVNPDDNTIDFTTVWQADATTTYTFTVHLEQVQL